MYLGGPPNATEKWLPSGCLQKILELTGKLALVVDDHLRCLASHEIGGLVQILNVSSRFITIVQIQKWLGTLQNNTKYTLQKHLPSWNYSNFSSDLDSSILIGLV